MSLRVHDLTSVDLLTRNDRRKLLHVHSLMLHRQVSRLPVEVDAQVPPALRDVLDGLSSSESLLSYGRAKYTLLLFAIDRDINASLLNCNDSDINASKFRKFKQS